MTFLAVMLRLNYTSMYICLVQAQSCFFVSLSLAHLHTPTCLFALSLLIHILYIDTQTTISQLSADCFSLSSSLQSWVQGWMWINLLKDFKFNFQWGPWRKALADRILLFSPEEGHRCCGTWSKNGRDVEWNGWWQYLNANENEVGFGEMSNVLYGRVVTWKHKLLPHVLIAARFLLHEAAGNKIKAPLLCRWQLLQTRQK